MKLAPDEQEMLEGKQRAARQKAMELLVKYAEGLGAERFVDTNNVTSRHQNHATESESLPVED